MIDEPKTKGEQKMKTPGYTAESSLRLSSVDHIGTANEERPVGIQMAWPHLPHHLNIPIPNEVKCAACITGCTAITDGLGAAACIAMCNDKVC